jgi:hypothetical protein
MRHQNNQVKLLLGWVDDNFPLLIGVCCRHVEPAAVTDRTSQVAEVPPWKTASEAQLRAFLGAISMRSG